MINLSPNSQYAAEVATFQYLSECFVLDAETGQLYWKARPDDHFNDGRGSGSWNARLAGKAAGTTCTEGGGRKQVRLLNRLFLYHRIVYALANELDMSEVPDIIDHINGDQSDNRPVNLREADKFQSIWNRRKKEDTRSAFKGISYHRRDNLWKSEIMANGKRVTLGYFKDEAQAAAAYVGAAKVLHGDYFRPTGFGDAA